MKKLLLATLLMMGATALWAQMLPYQNPKLTAEQRADAPDERKGWRRIPAKKRRIDPFVEGRGRAGALYPELGAAIGEFLREDITYFVRGEGT